MAQVVARDGLRVLVWTHTAVKEGLGSVQYGRILDLSTLTVWPEMYLDSLLAHGDWEPLEDPVPCDALLANARIAVLGSAP